MPLEAELFIYSPGLAQDHTQCAYGCQRLTTLQSVRVGGAALAAPSPGAPGPRVPPPSSAAPALPCGALWRPSRAGCRCPLPTKPTAALGILALPSYALRLPALLPRCSLACSI